ncbi:hypothetical protein HanRHA438_Chr03g0102611 [Helianthus annuus]|nr:hypothetical protein HanRHA438_Chr03g0102611 [Helianthus annuus]
MVGDLWFPPPPSTVPSVVVSGSLLFLLRLRCMPSPSPVPSAAVSGSLLLLRRLRWRQDVVDGR